MNANKVNWFARRAALNSTAAVNLIAALEENSRINAELFADSWPLNRFKLIQAWQRQRMAEDYQDFASQEDYFPAIDFFLTELYGDFGFIDRNHDLNKVYPAMVKLLPASMLDTLTDALVFQAHSLRMDMLMAECIQQLRPDLISVQQIDLKLYAELNHRVVAESSRRQQIGEVIKLGKSLVNVADHAILLRLLKMMRVPARAAGFGVLQTFLEQGLSAFQKMPDADYFLHTIEIREAAFIDQLY